MNTTISKLFLLLLFTTLSAGTYHSANADDTDIYLGGGSLTGNSIPNIVYVIDTSGSMSRTDRNWDNTGNLRGDTFLPNSPKLTIYPTATYREYHGYCAKDRYYWVTKSDYDNGKTPDCKRNTTQYIDAAALHCADAASVLANTSTVGFYKGRLAQDRGGWNTLGNNTDPVECALDYGKHGENGTTINPYPAKNSGWTNIDNPGTTSLAWSTSGSDYVLFNPNYLNWLQTDRLTTIMDVYADLLTGVVNSGAKMNIGIMRYDCGNNPCSVNGASGNANGGYFIVPLQEVTSANLQSYITAVDALRPGGFTPLTESLYEAHRFYFGLSSKFGTTSDPGVNPTSMYSSGTTFTSPVTNQCQKNFVILLTDGEPTYDTDADSLIRSLTGSSCSGNGACLDDLAGYMYNADCSSVHSGKQNVITYAIGFGADVAVVGSSADKLLKAATAAGGGESFLATTSDQVVNSLAKIILDIKRVVSIFTAPSVSVNAYNRNFHNDFLYFALFQPEAGPIWPGNVKTYKLLDTDGTIRDKNNQPVVDPVSATILPTALSYWTDTSTLPTGYTVDGDNIALGGTAWKLGTVSKRKTYTYTGSTAPNNENLTAISNKLDETNTAITGTMLGVPTLTATEIAKTLKWANGIDVNDDDGDGVFTDSRQSMGDPLHTQPVVLNYGPGTDDLVMYASTNEGFLHAFDVKAEGSEIFAFMPQELLPNIYPRMTNGALANHIYGLDGPLTVWYNDINNNGKIYSASGVIDTNTTLGDDFVYLYQGMRRGGNNYYALDVTDTASPKLKWKITGGAGGTTGFAELGQTWSAMKKTNVKINGTLRTVLIFGGGYDTAQDATDNLHTADTIGRSIYMIDANTGEKIWQAGPAGTAPERTSKDPDLILPDMTNSFPSDIVIIDTDNDNDHLVDIMYAADVGGKIWRFDVDNKNNTGTSDLVQGGVIASLYGDGTVKEDNRRFYHPPEVAISYDERYFNIAIGSGQRSAPKNQTVHDAVFVFRDYYVRTPPPKDSLTGKYDYRYFDKNDDGTVDDIIRCCNAKDKYGNTYLFDATNNILGAQDGDVLTDGTTVVGGVGGNLEAAITNFNRAAGWFISLYDYDSLTGTTSYVGEKVTSEATLIQDQLSFVTFTPVETGSVTVCKPSMGRGRVYRVNVRDATAVESNNSVLSDPRIVVETQGLMGRVQNIIGTHSWTDCTGLTCYGGGSLTPNKLGWEIFQHPSITP